MLRKTMFIICCAFLSVVSTYAQQSNAKVISADAVQGRQEVRHTPFGNVSDYIDTLPSVSLERAVDLNQSAAARAVGAPPDTAFIPVLNGNFFHNGDLVDLRIIATRDVPEARWLAGEVRFSDGTRREIFPVTSYFPNGLRSNEERDFYGVKFGTDPQGQVMVTVLLGGANGQLIQRVTTIFYLRLAPTVDNGVVIDQARVVRENGDLYLVVDGYGFQGYVLVNVRGRGMFNFTIGPEYSFYPDQLKVRLPFDLSFTTAVDVTVMNLGSFVSGSCGKCAKFGPLVQGQRR